LESLKKARFQNLENLVKKANKSQAEEAELERIISQIGKKEIQFIDRAILQHTDFVKNMNTSIIQGLIKAEEFDALDDIEKEMEKIIATPGSNVKASMGKAYDLYQTFKKKL
jgi:UDP-N-acetylglucosamine transferase subunit ALG13